MKNFFDRRAGSRMILQEKTVGYIYHTHNFTYNIR